MDYEHIYDACAKRSGKAITVHGKSRDGTYRRVANIDQIAVESGRFIATDGDKNKYVLTLAD